MFTLTLAALCFQACLVQCNYLDVMVPNEECPILETIEDFSDTEPNGQYLEELLNVPENVFGFGCGDGHFYGSYDFAPTAWGYGPFIGYDIPYAYYAREPLTLTKLLAGRLSEPFAANLIDAYGGAGAGDVAVAGDLPSAGTTAVAGIVPIVGAIEFGGQVCASGSVTIAGTCGCGCAGPFIYT